MWEVGAVLGAIATLAEEWARPVFRKLFIAMWRAL